MHAPGASKINSVSLNPVWNIIRTRSGFGSAVQ
jgi:hypothetical protein